MQHVDVSIIIPIHNAAQYLSECLDSLREQVYSNFEIICVDDGSADDSKGIVSRYVSTDTRIRLISQTHGNAGAARNRGYELSRGKYILFLDADDVFSPVLVGTLVDAIEKENADIAVCSYYSFKENALTNQFTQSTALKTFENPALNTDIFSRWMGWSWDKLIRRDLIERYRLRFQEIAASNDLGFVFSALSLAHKIVETDAVLVAHRLHAGSIETQRDKTPLCAAAALRFYFSKMQEVHIIACSSNLKKTFEKYVPRFVWWYLYTLMNDQAYLNLVQELPRLLNDLEMRKSFRWYFYCFRCWLKRPIRKRIRRRRSS